MCSQTPSNTLTNADLEKIVDTNDQWITERTGIKSRFICGPGENSLTLALASAKKSIEKSGLSPDEIDGVIIGTSSADQIFPALGCLIAGHLGIKGFGFDIQAACSGFVFAAHTARQFIENKAAKNILVIGVDVISKALDWNDRKTCVLFGDGAGSCLISATNEPGFVESMIGSEADFDFSLSMSSPWSTPNKLHKLHMDGQKVFKKAVGCLSSCVEELLSRSNLTAADIDLVVPHQANLRILQAVAERTSIPIEKYYQCLQRYGNTSAASIPLALFDAVQDGLIKPGSTIMLIAFGGGMTYGGAIIKMGAL
jgi:3-oxoacyl-[acyl-carrier-protein] synthase-3